MSTLKNNPLVWIGGCFFVTLLLFSALFLSFEKSKGEITSVERELLKLKLQSVSLFEKQKEIGLFRQKYGKGDPHFLMTHLETLPLLEKERGIMEEVAALSSLGEYEPIKERRKLLEANHISLVKVFEEETPFYRETHYKFSHPVEVERGDVEKILEIVEGKGYPLMPQLTIKNFILEKKEQGLYSLDMEIVQRVGNE